MKTKLFLLLWGSLLVFPGAGTKTSAGDAYRLNLSQSTLKWTGYYVFSFGSHHGTVRFSKGDLYVTGDIIKGSFEVDMNTIENEDIKGGDGALMLVEHLKSDDFFSVDKFPTSTLEIIGTEKIEKAASGEPNYQVTGSLTLKGTTNEIQFPATINREGNMLKASAKFKFDRTKWNIRYNSGRFFDDVGDGAISDGIGIEIDLVASKIVTP